MTNLPDSAKGLSPEQKTKFIGIVNAMLKSGTDEGTAIATAMKKAKSFEELTTDELVAEWEEFVASRKDEQTEDFFEGDWVEVFRAGEQTDSAGNTKTWTEEDLQKIESKYNSQSAHEAPLVVGHPKDNAPAFGWVEKLKANGATLLAKFKQVMPAFSDAVKEGRYKKRSISLYNDMTLRHIGFLGAVPPAVKGLADIKFNEDDDFVTVEFNEDESGNYKDDNKEKGETKMTKELQEQLDKANADVKSYGEKITELEKTSKEQADKIAEYEEAAKKAAEKKPEEKKPEAPKKTEFEEAAEKRIQEVESKLAASEKKNRIAEYKEFVKDLHSQGKMVTECQDTIIDLMEALHDKGEYEFAENGETKKADILETLKSYLEKQPAIVEMGETNTDAAKKNAKKSAGDQLNELAEAKVKEDKVSYSEALSQVQIENPELAQQAYSELETAE
jgi:uncharacterized protein YdaT